MRLDVLSVDGSQFPAMSAVTRVFLPSGERAEALPGGRVRVVEDTRETAGTITPTVVAGGTAWLFVVDQSGSMKPLMPAVSGAVAALSAAVGAGDRVGLVAFDAAPEVVHPFSSDRAQLSLNAARLGATGQRTELYFSLVQSLRQFDTPGLPAERVVVVLSDGRDEGRAYTLDDVVDRMREARVSVAAIGIAARRPDGRSALLNLRRLAEKTGGIYLEAGSSGDLASQVDLVRRQTSALQRVSWTSTLPRDGIARRVRLELEVGGVKTTVMLDTAPPLAPEAPAPQTDWFMILGATVVIAAAALAALAYLRRNRRIDAASPGGTQLDVPFSSPDSRPPIAEGRIAARWWLVWQEDLWPMAALPEGDALFFSSHDAASGEPRARPENFRSIRPGDTAVGYLKGAGLVAWLHVEAIEPATAGPVGAGDACRVGFRKLRQMPSPFSLEAVRREPVLAASQPMKMNCAGSLFKLTEAEWIGLERLLAAGPAGASPRLNEERRTIEVVGKMLVKNFKAAFKDEFGVAIKVHQGISYGHYADEDATVASIRSDKVVNPNGIVSLHGNMTVRTAEDSVRESLGFRIQILDKDGTNADNNARLSSLRS